MVSVLPKELECKVEKLKYKKMEVMQQRIKKLVTYFTHKPTDRNYLRRIPNHQELLLPKTAPQSSSFSLSATFRSYRKIPKVSPRAYIFQKPFLRGLFLEGLLYAGKFAFQNRLG